MRWLYTVSKRNLPYPLFCLFSSCARRLLTWFTGVAILFTGCGDKPGEREFKRGLKAFTKGEYVLAKAEFEKSVNTRPGQHEPNAIAYNYLGLAYWKLGDLQRAIDAFEDSRRFNPGMMEPYYNLGVLLFESGNTETAEEMLEQAGLVQIGDPRPLEYLGHIYRQTERWHMARRALYGALARDAHAPRILTALAMAELHTEGPDAAVSLLMRALDIDKNYPPALFDLAVIYDDHLESDKQALAFYRAFVEAAPAHARAAYARQALSRLSDSLEPKIEDDDNGDQSTIQSTETPAAAARVDESGPPQTFDEYLAAARRAHKAADSGRALSFYLGAAEWAQRAQDPARREEALSGAVKECPDRPEAYVAWGRFQLEKDETAAALNAFKRALDHDDEYIEAYTALAEAATRMNEYDTALVALKKAVSLGPMNAEALWTLTLLYDRHLEMRSRALSSYHEFAQRFPHDVRVVHARKRMEELNPAESTLVHTATLVREPESSAKRLVFKKPKTVDKKAAVQAYNRGTVYHRREEWDNAIYHYTQAIENDDEFVNAFFNLGVIYQAKGELDLAKDAYLYALAIRPSKDHARYNLALVYYTLRQYPAALEQAKQIIKEIPDYAPAYYLLGLIYGENKKTYSQARKNFTEFLWMAPDDPLAPAARQWLQGHR